MMTTKIQKRISIERVETLIEAYGSNIQCWPEQEREAARVLLAETPALQQLYAEAQHLDAALLADGIEEQLDEKLLSRIVASLPEQPRAHRKAWLHTWPAAMAAGIAALAIVLVVVDGPQPGQQAEQLAMQDMDYWLWQDVTGQSSSESNDDAPVDFMSML